MIVVVEERETVGSAYVAQFERDGVCGVHFDYRAFCDWIGAANEAEIAAIEAFLLGDGEGRVVVAQQIKRRALSPVLALLDRKCLADTLYLFDVGLDDVLGKPVHPREILARARAIRARRAGRMPAEVDTELVVPSDGRDPLVRGVPLALPRREQRILECLMQRKSAWCSKSHIFGWVYGMFTDGFDESVVESHICRLRRRLRHRLGYDPIESQRYLGYRVRLRDQSAVDEFAGHASSAQSSNDNLAFGKLILA